MMILKLKEYIVIAIDLEDEDGDPIANLSSAIAIKYMIKSHREDDDEDAIVSKSLTSGITINVDKDGLSKIGSARILLYSGDTEDIVPNTVYYHAIQIEWSSDIKNEADFLYNEVFSDEIKFIQDVIR
jgi:hypothetical protein